MDRDIQAHTDRPAYTQNSHLLVCSSDSSMGCAGARTNLEADNSLLESCVSCRDPVAQVITASQGLV